LERLQEALSATPGISLNSGVPKTPLPSEFTPPAQETPSLVDRVLPKVYDPLQQQQQEIAKLATSFTPVGTADDFNKAVQDKDPWGLTLAGAGIIPGGGLLSRARNLPKLFSGYHGTKVPDDFTKFKLPPPEQDLGIHFSTDPRVARQYSLGMNAGGTLSGHDRTIPVVADIRSSVKFPQDPIVWNQQDQFRDFVGLQESNSVLETLKKAPGYEKLYQDLSKLEGKPGGWNANFIPEMQNRGYDAIQYPHFPEYRTAPQPFNSYMVFDPNQIHGKFTPEGQALIAERGARKPKSILTMRPGEEKFWQDTYNQSGAFEKSKAEVYKKLGVDPDTPLGHFFVQFPEYTVNKNSELVKNPKYKPYTQAQLDEFKAEEDRMYPASKGWKKTASGFSYIEGSVPPAFKDEPKAWFNPDKVFGDPHSRDYLAGQEGVQQYSIPAKPGPLEQAGLDKMSAKGITMTHPGYFKSDPEQIVKNIFPKASKDKLDELIKALMDWENRQ
jgi:hypothetical protein